MEQNNIDTSKMLKTAKNAIHTALLHHKAIDNEIVFFKDGKIIREKLSDNFSTSKKIK